jgi:RNA polymerase primary sigma factor
MQDKESFMAMLSAIVDLAKSQDNILAMDEVKKFFDDSNLSDEQFDHVYEYLAANQIRIQGYIRKETSKGKESNLEDNLEVTHLEEDSNYVLENTVDDSSDDEKQAMLDKEEEVYVSMYLEDLESIPTLKECELEKLYLSLLEGDETARASLLETNLIRVVDIAKEYKGQGVTIGDLIQEGNIGLISALDEITSKKVIIQADPTVAKEYVMEAVRQSMEAVIHEQSDNRILEKRVVDRINYFNNCVKELAEDLGREATIDELSQYAKVDRSEIEDIMLITPDAISVKMDDSKNKK